MKQVSSPIVIEAGMDQNEDTRVYMVLKNHEEQYSLWLKANEVPAGWKAAGKVGQRAECLEYVRDVWRDMRPLSARINVGRDELGNGASYSDHLVVATSELGSA